ncbi:MAG TPA: S8 family peptidase, partial [Hyphomicrobium sp.]|nr:S8 family peptidase [Hyphomicrobium sp.]
MVAAQGARPAIPGINPELILKVSLTRPVDEDEWRRAGFTVIAQNPDNVFVLFADNRELRLFRERLEAFQGGPPEGQKGAPHANLIGSIERAGEVSPEDRIGPHMQAQGLHVPADIDGRQVFVVDVELWDPGQNALRMGRAQLFANYLEVQGAERIGEPFVTNNGLLLLRARMQGTLLRVVLERQEVSLIDYTPMPDLGDRDPPSIPLGELPPRRPPPPDAPIIGIVDSGLNAHPLLEEVTIEATAFPAALGAADEYGHGTKVAGIATYGDLRERLAARSFDAPVRLISTRVVNAQGRFDDFMKLPEQMRGAINALADRGCRVINMSLGDKDLIPYADRRASSWASELDTLARERDLLIVVSTGNAKAPWGRNPDAIITEYPGYLTAPENRLIDPATAANVITVGALAHANGLHDNVDSPQVQHIADRNEPSPITRSGPGIGGAIKPELCDYGGTVIFDGHSNSLQRGQEVASAGVVTLEPEYRRSLFTAATGTSFAAPRIAYKAALLAGRYPQSSANMLRAMLALSADIPQEAALRLDGIEAGNPPGPNARQCLGYGVPDLVRALASDDNRAILLADRQELELDQVALYAVPIPDTFRSTKGPRTIRVSLAFDPPVRHTRMEYLAVRMSFKLLRGLSHAQVLDHFKRRDDKTPIPEVPSAAFCDLDPGIQARGSSTLQCATFTQKVNADRY